LKQQAAGVPGLILVDFQLMPACCAVGQQCCIGGNRQSVCQIGGCVESKLVHALDIRSGGVGPLTLGKGQQGQPVLIPCHPTLFWRDNPPGIFFSMGQRIFKPGPSAGRAARQNIASSGNRVRGGRSLGPAENTKLHHTIQQAHTLIMGDMFLRLVL